MKNMLKYFDWSFGILIVGMSLAFWRGEVAHNGAGFAFLFYAMVICVLEISLSFDNAVINATKLEKMSRVWRRRFLTWGIAIAVFGMRFVFPIVIVSAFSGISTFEVLKLALNNPDAYATHLKEAHIGISSFGGTFLFMLFMSFMADTKKNVHWLGFLEKPLAFLGKVPFFPTISAFVALLIVQLFLGSEDRVTSMVAGTVGIVLHLLIHGVSEKLEHLAAKENVFALKHAGLAAFIYLELIDASFSLDGVLGAFALTKDVVVIAIGLAVGAFFVRSLTILLVEKKTLDKFVYLTHGAYWAIGALAVIMLVSIKVEVPEVVTGLLGMVLILSSAWSSHRVGKAKSN